jgi:hypothetical protein
MIHSSKWVVVRSLPGVSAPGGGRSFERHQSLPYQKSSQDGFHIIQNIFVRDYGLATKDRSGYMSYEKLGSWGYAIACGVVAYLCVQLLVGALIGSR